MRVEEIRGLQDGDWTLVANILAQVAAAINGGLQINDNLSVSLASTTCPAVANTEFSLFHSLNRTPIGFLVTYKDRAADVYASNSESWTKTRITLKCNTASAVVKVLVF